MTPVQTVFQTPLRLAGNLPLSVNPGFACYGAFLGHLNGKDVQTVPKDTNEIGQGVSNQIPPTNQELIAALTRAKVAFQLATLRRVMGL